MKLRALLGEFDGDSTVFLGAVEYDLWANLDDGEWAKYREVWLECWSEITDTREVDVELRLPYDPFELPPLEASLDPRLPEETDHA